MDGSKIIDVRSVVKIYESGYERVVALREVSLSVNKGEVVAIMGPSGSGKTTLLNIISGVDRPTAGMVVVDGVDLTRASDEELRRYRLSKIGYVFQQYNLVPTLTAIENVLLPMALAGRRDVSRARRLLERVGLKGKENRFPEELSGGEQQRLAIAVALANDPPIIIADEPTGELDIGTGEKIVRLILDESRKRGKTIVMTTHDPRVARMADRVVLIEDGRIVGSYEPSRIAAGSTAAGEIVVERAIADHLKRMLEDARRRIEVAAEMFRRGEISVDDFVREYMSAKALEEALREELSKIGAGPELSG